MHCYEINECPLLVFHLLSDIELSSLCFHCSTGDVNLCGMSGEVATTEDNVPKGLVVWREAVGRAHTSAQLAMALYMLEASIAWDKSIMKAVSSVSSASGKGSSVGIRLILLYHSFCHRFSSLPIPHPVTY